jgi:hypothetical protein
LPNGEAPDFNEVPLTYRSDAERIPLVWRRKRKTVKSDQFLELSPENTRNMGAQ